MFMRMRCSTIDHIRFIKLGVYIIASLALLGKFC